MQAVEVICGAVGSSILGCCNGSVCLSQTTVGAVPIVDVMMVLGFRLCNCGGLWQHQHTE
jgi:hypothetical protein